MLDSSGIRQLAYLVRVDAIEQIQGSDNCEAAIVGGWRVMVRKGTFKPNDVAIYFEIDSKVDTNRPEFAFLASKNGKIKTQRYTFGGKGLMISQGLLMHPNDFGWITAVSPVEPDMPYVLTEPNNPVNSKSLHLTNDSRFLTSMLGVTYSAEEDKEDTTGSGWPVGKFPGVSKTDQERCENMPWVLNDKTPFIVTQKCDGSSGTYILERVKKNKYEFYVCSRNVRMMKPDQECFYKEKSYYWEVATKYDIENKMRDYLAKNPDISFVCWQGEICAPGIQKNPHHLIETHFYAFHMTDSKTGRFDIRDAAKIWNEYGIETVPIVDTNYIMPDDFEEFKKTADGKYDPSVCEGNPNCAREGFVYYKTTVPTFSFKNVSREYLLDH